MIARWLFALARQRWVGALVGFGFAYGSCLLPVKRVRETRRILAFYHPRPSWPGHMLLVPKRRIPSLLHLLDDTLLLEIVQMAGEITAGRTAVLCANGGARQEIAQLHFHLIPGEEWVSDDLAPQGAGQNHRPQYEVHEPISAGVPAGLPALVARDDLLKQGYSLVVQNPGAGQRPLFHVIAGAPVS